MHFYCTYDKLLQVDTHLTDCSLLFIFFENLHVLYCYEMVVLLFLD